MFMQLSLMHAEWAVRITVTNFAPTTWAVGVGRKCQPTSTVQRGPFLQLQPHTHTLKQHWQTFREPFLCLIQDDGNLLPSQSRPLLSSFDITGPWYLEKASVKFRKVYWLSSVNCKAENSLLYLYLHSPCVYGFYFSPAHMHLLPSSLESGGPFNAVK